MLDEKLWVVLLYVQYVYESKYVFECIKPKTFSKDLCKYRITKFEETKYFLSPYNFQF